MKWLLILLLVPLVLLGCSNPSSDTLIQNLSIYLDANYTTRWDAENVPDLNQIPWTDPAPDGNYNWHTGTLTAYLQNNNKQTVKVHVTAFRDASHMVPGYSVSSDTVTLKSGEKRPIIIKIKEITDEVAGIAPGSNRTLYFNVESE